MNMREWEYYKLDLNNLPRKVDDVDLLSDAGKNGWELVQINPNNIAYLKRPIEAEPLPKPAKRKKD
jgi:hypothetical protein